MPDVTWTVVGEGSLRPRLEALAAQYGVEAQVRFLGDLSDEERDRWYRSAHVFVMPSRLPPEGGGEGFGIVYLEAAAHGLPVVAGNVAGARDAVVDGETGLLVDPTDHLEVAAAADAPAARRGPANAVGANAAPNARPGSHGRDRPPRGGAGARVERTCPEEFAGVRLPYATDRGAPTLASVKGGYALAILSASAVGAAVGLGASQSLGLALLVAVGAGGIIGAAALITRRDPFSVFGLIAAFYLLSFVVGAVYFHADFQAARDQGFWFTTNGLLGALGIGLAGFAALTVGYVVNAFDRPRRWLPSCPKGDP